MKSVTIGKRKLLSIFKIPSVPELPDELSELPAGEMKSCRRRDEQHEKNRTVAVRIVMMQVRCYWSSSECAQIVRSL